MTTSGSALRPVSEIETQSDDVIDELIDDHRFDALPSWFSIFNWDDETLNANRAAWHSRLLGKNNRQIGSTVNAKSNILTAHRQKEDMAFSESDQKDLEIVHKIWFFRSNPSFCFKSPSQERKAI